MVTIYDYYLVGSTFVSGYFECSTFEIIISVFSFWDLNVIGTPDG